MTKLLVVDDNETNRCLLQILLARHGYEVILAADGVEALEKARENPPDLLITDILMPGMDGYSLCRQWKRDEKLKEVPFVFYTATYTDFKDRQLALDMGAERFIVKPQEQGVFLDTIGGVIEENKAGRKSTPRVPVLEETVYLKQYNAALVRKLEDKLVELESANVCLEHLVIEHRQTEEKAERAAHDMLASETRYRRLFESAKDGILILDADTGEIVDVNPFLCELLGFDHGHFLGKKLWEIGVFKDIAASEAAYSELQEKEYIRYDDLPLETRDGRHIATEFVSNVYLVGLTRVIQCNIRDITKRRRAEEALRKDEAELGCILDTTIDGVLAVGNDGKIIRANRRFAEMFRIPQATLAAKDDQPVLDSVVEQVEDSGAFLRKVQALYQSNDKDMETISFKDGRAYERYSAPLTVEDSVVGRVWFFHDITERRRALQALEQSERTFRTLFNSAGDGMILLDLESGKFLMCNAVCSELLGYTQEEFIHLDIADLHPPEDLPFLLEQFGNFVKGKRSVRSDIRFKRKDGTVLLADLSPALLTLNGRESSLLVFRDITERRRAEEALRESEAKLELALQSAQMGVWQWDIAADVRSFDKQACRLLGLDPAVYQGPDTEFLVSVHPDDREKLMGALAQVIAEDVPGNLEYRAVWPDGSIHHIGARGRLARDKAGLPRSMSGVIWDITERKQAETTKAGLEAQLQQAQRMESVGRLAGGVAHDFNNMLAVILGYTEVAMGQVGPEQPLHDDLEEINKAGNRAADLTRQLLAFARRQTVMPKVLDLNQAVAGMVNMLQRLIGEDIQLNWRPGADLWPVRVDPSQIDQVVANLCVNARDAIADVGKITIATENRSVDEHYCAGHPDFAPGEYVLLTVSDSGRGMDKETLTHIFEPFFTTKELGKGTGLGLATLYGIVKQNNGFINVYSEVGHGTAFRIYLPRHAGETEQARAQDTTAANPRGSETILLVEDELAVLQLTTRLLETQGYTVLAAPTPGEAVRMAQEHEGAIHLLMTDVVMPEMNGRDLARNLLSLHPRLKCLFMSGYTANVIAHHGVLDEGVCFLQKPFTQEDMSAKIREALAASGGRDDAPGK